MTPTPDFVEFIIGRAFARPVGSIPLRMTHDAAGNGFVAELLVLRNCFRFRGIADMTGPVAGTIRSRLTQR